MQVIIKMSVCSCPQQVVVSLISTPQLIIGESGIILSILANSVSIYVQPTGNVLLLTMPIIPTNLPNIVNLNTATSIELGLQYPDLYTTTTLTMTSSSDGNSAIRTLEATDFPNVGTYMLELIVTIGSEVFKSLPQNLSVGGFI